MRVRSVAAMYFSPTGTTGRVVTRIAEALSAELGPDHAPAHHDLTSPRARSQGTSFSEGAIAVVGVPVYAGRVPRFLLDYLHAVRGAGALAIAVVVYGNRHYDDALIELAGAKSFSDGNYLTVKRWLEGHCAERRTPELFL